MQLLQCLDLQYLIETNVDRISNTLSGAVIILLLGATHSNCEKMGYLWTLTSNLSYKTSNTIPTFTESVSVLRQRQKGGQDAEQDIDTVLRHHHQMQEKVAEEMVHLAKTMKENARTANRIVKDDTKVCHVIICYFCMIAHIKVYEVT